MLEKPVSMPKSLDDRLREKFDEDDDYRGNDSLLTIDILIDEADYKFGKSLSELSFAEKTELSAPETISRKRREYYSQGNSGETNEWENIESRILLKVQENSNLVNSDKALTIELWIDEAEDRFEKDLNELSDSEKKDLSKPESFSKKRRILSNQGFISADKGVQVEREEKQDRFREYYRKQEAL